MTGDMLKSGVCSEKQSTIQLEKHLQQCVTRLNQTESLMCVWGGGGGGAAVSLCKLCLQLSSNKRENISTLVLATKSLALSLR